MMVFEIYKQKGTGHIGTIEKVRMRAYKGAPYGEGYRVIIEDEGFMFHCNCFETHEDARYDLEKCGGSWELILEAQR